MNIETIQNLFHPEIYPDSLPVSGPLKLCLARKSAMATYVLCVSELSDEIPFEEQVEISRREIRRSTSALWLIREVGAYLVFISSKRSDLDFQNVESDKTGFHSVILQGIHVIDSSGCIYKNYSSWGSKSFGGSADIASRIENSAI